MLMEKDCTWNAHSIGAQIPKPQNAAAVSHNNDLHIVTGPVAHDFIKAALVPECREVHSQRLPAFQDKRMSAVTT